MVINKKTAIYVGAGLASVLIGYFAFDLLKTKADQKRYGSLGSQNYGGTSGSGTVGEGEISSDSAQSSSDSYPIGVGSYGAKVWVLQEALNKLGASLTVDGKFGEKTYSSVNNITFGFGLGNALCGVGYSCKVSYDNWQNIVDKATEKGFNVNQSWANAKKQWKV